MSEIGRRLPGRDQINVSMLLFASTGWGDGIMINFERISWGFSMDSRRALGCYGFIVSLSYELGKG